MEPWCWDVQMQPCQYLIQQLRNLVSIYAFIQIHVQHWHLQILFNTEIHNVEYKEINGNRNVNRDCSFNGVNHDSWVTQQRYLGDKMHMLNMLNKRLHIAGSEAKFHKSAIYLFVLHQLNCMKLHIY